MDAPRPSHRDPDPRTPRAPLPFVIGHRGAAGHAPENTLASLRAAAALGCRWVEVDVRPAACGRPVLMHDADLARTTGRSGAVETTPFEQVAGLPTRAAGGASDHGEPVPSLDEALALAVELGLGVDLELKPAAGRRAPVAPAVVDAVRRHFGGAADRVLLSSGCSLELAAARAAAPDLPLASLHRRLADDWRRDVDAHGLCALGLDDDHLEIGQLQAVASARPDLALLVYTVNAPRRAAELAAAGVTSVFSDVPDVLTPPSHEPARAG